MTQEREEEGREQETKGQGRELTGLPSDQEKSSTVRGGKAENHPNSALRFLQCGKDGSHLTPPHSL